MWIDRFDLFHALRNTDRALLAKTMTMQTYRPGHVFVREGTTDPDGAMYLVVEGSVEVVADAPRNGFGVHRTMGPGSLFGLVALVDASPRTATVRALGPVRAASLDVATLDALRETAPGPYARLQMCIARQLAADLRRLSSALTEAAEGREALLLDSFVQPE